MTLPPNKSPEPTAVGAGRSAVAVHVACRRWFSFLRWAADHAMKKLIFTFVVTMLATHLPAQIIHAPYPVLTLVNLGGGSMNIISPDLVWACPYSLQATTNLVNWTVIYTNSLAPPNGVVTKMVQVTNTMTFYRGVAY